MFKGSLIPGILNLSGILDRTLWVFRRHYYAYLMINLLTFGPVFLIVSWLVVWGIIDLEVVFNDFVNYIGWIVIYLLFFITLPSVVSDLAMQEYTSSLVRDSPIPWNKAIKRSITTRLFHYLLTKLIGSLVFALGSVISLVLIFVPIIGQFATEWVRLGGYSFFVGISPAIIIEEKTNFLQTLKRNMGLASKKFLLFINASFVGWYISLALIGSCFFLILSVFGLIAALSFSNDQYFMPDSTVLENFLMYFIFYTIPLIGVVLFMPLHSIFSSVMYYNLRSRESAFHLENKLDIYTQKLTTTPLPN